MKHTLSLITLIAAGPVFAETTRQLDAHEHGVGALDIAIEGTTVAMELHAPGADIVGFEYQAESDVDRAKIEAALAVLAAPLSLFDLPEAAGCFVVDAVAELEGDEDHGHEGHDEGEHGDHSDEAHDDHDNDEHDDHDDHDEEEAELEGADPVGGAGHTEFHAAYTLTCDAPDALTEIAFPYFEAFPNALGVEVQLITTSGAQAFEVLRAAPSLTLGR